jgi:hypothetical protein
VAAVIVLTALACVVAVAGDGPIRSRPEPYVPSRGELIEIGVITSDYPIPGQLPPQVYPPEAFGLGAPGVPAWLWALLAAIAAGAGLWATARIVRALARARWRLPRLRRRRRRRSATAPDESLGTGPVPVALDAEAQAAHDAVAAGLGPLREPADPRAAVIDAYARMEQVLADRELGRWTPEAPREYLRRVLGRHGMPEDALTRLTALFEEARFSRHPIPDSAPRRAAVALETARLVLSSPGSSQADPSPPVAGAVGERGGQATG